MRSETARQVGFGARTATQQPDATSEDLEHYLSFLVEDVGYQHLPYNDDDSRHPKGKSDMRKGMTFYLGKNKSFTAELVNFTHGSNVVATQYKGVHMYQREGGSPLLKMAEAA